MVLIPNSLKFWQKKNVINMNKFESLKQKTENIIKKVGKDTYLYNDLIKDLEIFRKRL